MAGPQGLTEEDIAAIDRNAQVQVDYLDKFERDLIANPPPELISPDLMSQTILVEPPRSISQRIAQAESYGNSVWQSTINVGRGIVVKQGAFDVERRVHLLAEHEHKYCQTCISQSRMGWQPVGTLNEIGDSECMGSCDCYFEWMSKGDPKIYVSPWGRHNPKGYNQPGSHGTRLPGIAYPLDRPDEPTREEIDVEVKKWIAGKPSRLTVKVKGPRAPFRPDIGSDDEYEWSSEETRLEYEREHGT